MGAVRHVADIRADDFDRAGSNIIGLQAGSNKGASQAGMSMGSVRHVSDIRLVMPPDTPLIANMYNMYDNIAYIYH